jgi:hypothetical protein
MSGTDMSHMIRKGTLLIRRSGDDLITIVNNYEGSGNVSMYCELSASRRHVLAL